MKKIVKDDCIFCKIINKSAPSYVIAENKFAIAFLDNSRDLLGHTLVIPKSHCESIFDCEDKYLSETIKLIRKVSNHYVKDLGFDGVNIINASGKAAEQGVFHMHFHIYPRKNDDGIKISPVLQGTNFKLEDAHKIFKLDL